MARHKKYDLLDIVVQAVNESGWNVLYVGDIKYHPFVLKIYNDIESYLLRIYIWNITPGGNNRPDDERRIQPTNVDESRFQQLKGERTLILGWWREAEVFAGWDYNKHKSPLGKSSSFQIREGNLRLALLHGFSPYDKGNDEIAIAFRPDFLISYIQNLDQLHDFGTSKKGFKALEEIAEQPLVINTKSIKGLNKQRQIVVQEVVRKIRDANFKARVLTAYGNRCAFSGLQLKLVDAAHILPVSAENSTDETSNGIALSALYHRAYDRGLITFNEKYQTIVNETKMKQLRDIGFDGGMNDFIRSIRPIINLPPAVNDRPNVNFIKQANKLRGWT